MRLHVHEWGEASAPPLVCLHGVTAHGRRFRKLAEEVLAARFRVLSPDLRGHGRSAYEPPWDIETHLADVLETIVGSGVAAPATWLGHSFGGRLVLELAARRPELVERAVLLDPAIQILPHVAYDFAEEARKDVDFGSQDEAVEARLAAGATRRREFLEEEMREHLVPSPGGRLHYQYCRSTVVTGYSELATEPPAVDSFEFPVLLVYARDFGLVREEQVDAYRAALGERLTLVSVPGGHTVYWDAYEQTAAALDAFLG
jgi:lipase